MAGHPLLATAGNVSARKVIQVTPRDARRRINGQKITTGAPPLTGTFFSLLSAPTKPSHRPSGEKNGELAPSVPASVVVARSLNLRTRRTVVEAWSAT